MQHLLTKSEYCNYNHWDEFGGLVYRPKDNPKMFGINMERTSAFLHGMSTVARSMTKNILTGEKKYGDPIYFHQVRKLNTVLDADGFYSREAALIDPNNQMPLL